MADSEKLAEIFKVLSVDTRLRIVQLLKNKALCVNALAARLDVTAAVISQHLRILRNADLVVADRQGYYVHYTLNEKTLRRWQELANGFLRVEAE
ncbi:winged helix-turn-helix transcriptional regulator [PVC group bacterium]|nr:winged helix-turn-helix transcriptional regulator [PVC group bacterium]